MSPLEIEEETMSLFDETNGRAPTMRKRNRVSLSTLDGLSDSTGSGFRGLLRSKTSYAIRNACLLATLAGMVFTFIDVIFKAVESLPMNDENPRGIHQSSFGGINNPASIAGQKAHHQHEEDKIHNLDLIPQSNVGQHVPSFSVENQINHVGHYRHDAHFSVYSSPLYDGVSQRDLDKAQVDFLERLNATKNRFGSWDLVDTYYDENADNRPQTNFDVCPNRDCNMSDFPVNSWQMDQEYVGNFVDEAKKMIDRVKEGIYEEYGHSSFKKDGTDKSEKEKEERSKIFQVIVAKANELDEQNVAVNKDTKKVKLGVAQVSKVAWDGLVLKLLHSLVTNDNFFVVVAGDGAAAGHGNNFAQSPIMQFHYLMEPIMDFMGIRLVSRNMAMNGQSTVFEAMGGADIYGEIDLLWYDSSFAGDSAGAKDLLYKQSILGGERVPVILTNDPVKLSEDSSKTAWIGNLQPNDDICGLDTKGVCDMNSHNSVCWIPRICVTPEETQGESIPPESFPGNYAHQLEARKLTMLFLHALDVALDKWVEGIEADGFPLVDSYWHVGDAYENIREKVRTSHDDKMDSACELMMKDLAMVCHMEMHGNTEWTPRVTPYACSLRALLPISMTVGNYFVSEQYSEVDLMPKQWAIPEDKVDPHLIAIASSAPPPEDNEEDDYFPFDDDQWIYYDDDGSYSSSNDNDVGDGEGASTRAIRRRLQDASTLSNGKGWTLYNAPAGFCDGSAQSTCGRDKKSKCLMAGHNDYQAGILGDALSGWLMLTVRNVKEGIILARFDIDVPAEADIVTEGWTAINNSSQSEGNSRRLNLPDDFNLDYSINGEFTSLSKTEFISKGVEIADGMILHPLFIDSDMGDIKRDKADKGETVKIGVRIRSKEGRAVTVALTHLFYA